jgi:hypothetical protein
MVGAALGSQRRGITSDSHALDHDPERLSPSLPLRRAVMLWRQTANELPQPQVWLALGLVKLNPPPISAFEKSSCMP